MNALTRQFILILLICALAAGASAAQDIPYPAPLTSAQEDHIIADKDRIIAQLNAYVEVLQQRVIDLQKQLEEQKKKAATNP